jgi:acylphosphatase
LLAKRFVITGRVQGVYFRASTQQQAQLLNVCGYAKNLPTGAVEVIAVGDAAAVSSLEQWLWQGPPTAHVKHVQVEALDWQTLGALPTRFTTA